MERESWHLMMQGRLVYTELPLSSNPWHVSSLEHRLQHKTKAKGITACDKVNEEHAKLTLLHQKEVARTLTSGEVSVGNVWGSNDITDTIRLLNSQLNRRHK